MKADTRSDLSRQLPLLKEWLADLELQGQLMARLSPPEGSISEGLLESSKLANRIGLGLGQVLVVAVEALLEGDS